MTKKRKKRKKKWKGWWCLDNVTPERKEEIKKSISKGIKAAWNKKTPEEKALYAKHHGRKMKFAYMRKTQGQRDEWRENKRKGILKAFDETTLEGRERKAYHRYRISFNYEMYIKGKLTKEEIALKMKRMGEAGKGKKRLESFEEYVEREQEYGVVHG